MKYEKWSWGYWCLKQYVRFIDWIIHKKTILIGKENIPKNKPILFAPNHQNALSDPMAILLHTRFQPVWLARADIFKNGIITLILRFLKIMPVYRLRDGKEQLAKNDKTFADSIKVLQNNFALALFPEATHSAKRQMLAHKKAIPRIVFMAEDIARENLDIHIIPVGIYYSSYWKFNRTVIVNFGRPIRVNNFLEENETNSNSSTLALRDSIYEAIDKLIINIKSKEHYNDFELIREIYGKHYLSRQGKTYSTVNLLESDQILTNKLDTLEAEKPEILSELIQQTKSFNTLVRKHKLRSWLVEKPENNLFIIMGNKLFLLLLLPAFLCGFLFNAIPFFTTDILIRKKIKDRAFWSTFSLGSGIVFFPIVYLLQLWAVSFILPNIWLMLLVLIAMPISGKIAFRWYILGLKTWGRGRLFILKMFNKKTHNKLIEKQKQLFDKLDEAISY